MNWNVEDIDLKEDPIFSSRREAIMFKRMMENMQVYAPTVPESFKNFASCKVNCVDSVETLKEGFEYKMDKNGGLGIVIDAPGGDNLVNDAAIRSAIRSLDGSVVIPKEREPIHFKMKGIMDYALHNIYFDSIECTPILDIEKDEKKPPVGRTQKQHNLIQAMNKRGRR